LPADSQPQWGRGGGMARRPGRCGVPCQGRQILCLVCCSRHRTIADIAASSSGCSIWAFFSHWLRLRDLGRLAGPPTGKLRRAGQLRHALTCWPACWWSPRHGSSVIGRRLGRHPLSPISPEDAIAGSPSVGGLELCWSVASGVLLAGPGAGRSAGPARRSGLGVRLGWVSDRNDDEAG